MSLISTMRKFLIPVKGVIIKRMMQSDGQENDQESDNHKSDHQESDHQDSDEENDCQESVSIKVLFL